MQTPHDFSIGTDIGSNHAVVHIGDLNLFFSYSTLVACSYFDKGHRTHRAVRSECRYSNTTARHMGKMGCAGFDKVSEDELRDFVYACLTDIARADALKLLANP